MSKLYRATKDQEGIYVEYLKSPQSLSFNLATVCKLNGLLNIEALKSALNAVVQRFEQLRVCFVEDEDNSILNEIG